MKSMSKLSIVIFLLIHFSLVFAQENTWYQTYNPFADPDRIFDTYYIHNIWQETDSSFTVAGSFYCEEWCYDEYVPASYGFVMDININGNMSNFSQKQWFDIDIVEIPEIGYACTGTGSYLNKLLDNEFNVISSFGSWNTHYYSIHYIESDNSILLSGRPYNGDFFLQKFDIEINQDWLYYYDLPFYFDTAISDNGITLLGSNSTTWWADDLKLIHVDSNGEFQWEQELDYFGHDITIFHKVSFINTSDNGYLIGGRIDTPNHHGFVLKTYSDGNLEWLNIYDGIYPINAFTEKDDGYILWDTEGCSMLSVNLSGELLWSHSFEYSDYPNIHKVLELSNGYLINGMLNSDSCYFAKINDEGQVSIQNNSVIPQTILLNNFPNPFNPSTTISFSIQNDSNIELSIYNIKGQKIKTIAHNKFNKGNHSIIWNGDDETGKSVSSGVYLYKLIVNDKSEAMKKCLLLK